MQRLASTIGMVIALLGLAASPANAADPFGPVCLRFDKFIESFEIWLMPSGGQNYVITGHNRLSDKTVTGSGRLTEESFLFYFLTPLGVRPGLVFEGELRLATQLGSSRYFFLNDPPTQPAGDSIVSVFRCP